MAAPATNHEARLTMVEAAVVRIEGAIGQIAEALQMLSRLDAQHQATSEAVGRSFQAVDDLEKRVQVIEIAMPGLKETRGWVIAGILGSLAMLGTALVGLVLIAPKG